MALDRIRQLASQLTGTTQGLSALRARNPEDVVITMAIRSPLTKAKRGALKDTGVDGLLLELFKQTIANSKVDPALVGDICVGTVLTPDACYHARGASLAAGFPESVPVQVMNRFCSSGLMAATTIANQIRVGQIEVGLAIGVESMSQNPDNGGPAQCEAVTANPASKDCLMPMGWTSENVAKEFSVSREIMDEFSAMSYQRAEVAQKEGRFKKEIVPFTVDVTDPKTGEKRRVTVDQDDGIRYGTTQESLSKIRAAFPQWQPSCTTGGNASQITDGAAAVMMMTRRKAEQLGLPIMGKFVTTTVTGVVPRVMGIGPAYAIPMLLEKAGISQDDVDMYEINEAFASQYVYCIKALGLSPEKVNVNGGAIAFGHPLGCTGVRQIVTGLHEMERRGAKVLVTSMCIGTGMGAAGLFVRD
ncbi:thiolase [Coniophora puteana RWD-64-598 SS2]|uniref:Thiolase n=1 Tax=Coniophora puteana (strain RWD-64-598) TaxID=741705 RepID=A0A5M3N613_CONPW|nr:thiolase [Coniophora puteana RWD-64-598 SS2]EIW86870.1 thiolase [Coniophora puteana RWD-64-598 SS2]